MTRDKAVIDAIKEEGINIIYYVPCSTMIDVIHFFESDATVEIYPISREEEGIGLITGAYLSGLRPLLLIQDSGLGNSYNAIIALLHCYNIPVPIMVTRRGSVGEISAPNAMWAENTSMVNKVMGIQEFLLGAILPIEMWKNAIKGAFYHSKLVNKPVIIQVNLRNKGEFND